VNGRGPISDRLLALSNSVTLAALVELLEEKGVVSKQEVLGRVKRMQEQTRRPD
jgi:predicted transcriptional regulator